MNNNSFGVIVIVIVIIIVIGQFAFVRVGPREVVVNQRYDGFAKCLAEKNIIMYGADWCSHCQNEKKAFGDSFRFVPYVECPDNPQKCLARGVKGYPTWIFPDGRKLEGEQGLENLSRESGCELNRLGD